MAFSLKQKLKLLEEIKKIAQKASESIMDIYKESFEIQIKNDGSPLTKADENAHHVIKGILSNIDPQLPLLSEESLAEEFKERRNWKSYWLVDPLDGTKEFVSRNGEFTVNIALIEDTRATLGVVIAPAMQIEYSGITGLGAWRREKDGKTCEIKVSQPHNPCIRVLGSRSHSNAGLENYLATLGNHKLKKMGSSLKICRIAEGEADLYPRFSPTSEWDTAASQAILESAGGSMIDLDGQPIRYNTKNGLLNPHFLAVGDPEKNWLKSALSD